MIIGNFDKRIIEQSTEQKNKMQKINGLKRLNEVGINPEEYRKFFGAMREIDIPFKQALPDPLLVKQEILSIEEIEEMWEVVRLKYASIKIDKTIEGMEIISKIKILVENYTKLLKQYKDEIKRNNECMTNPSEELMSTRKQMLELSDEFNNVPAYLSYRLYGMYEMKSDSIPADEYFRNRSDIA
jgi:hypothetical protein